MSGLASTRRNLLGCAAGSAAATAILSSATPRTAKSHPDAVLLAMCATFMVANAEKLRLDHALTGVSDEALEAATHAWFAPIDAITALPATTQEGVRAKARVMIAVFEGAVPKMLKDTVESEGEYHELLAWRLAHDVLHVSAVA